MDQATLNFQKCIDPKATLIISTKMLDNNPSGGTGDNSAAS